MEEKLKVILIDDEMLIRKLIRMKIDTEGLNLNIIKEFSNGMSALEEIEDLRPDIVISDICMPEIDGISFSEKCVELLPNVKIIIVTGYDDFEYARRSVKAGVFDYLMKPVQSEELNSTLHRAVKEIRKDKAQKEQQSKFLVDMQKNLPKLREIYLNQILVNEDLDEEMEEKLIEYGVIVKYSEKDSFQVAILVVRESVESPELISKANTEAEQFFECDSNIWVVQDSWGRIVIINSKADLSFSGCLDILIEMIEKKLNCHVQFGVSSQFSGWKEIHKSYISALQDTQQKHSSKNIQKEDLNKLDRSDWTNIVKYIKEGKTDDAVKLLHDTLQQTIFTKDNKDNRQKAFMILQRLCIDTEINQTQIQMEHILSLCRSSGDLQWAIIFLVRMMSIDKAIEADKGSKIGEIIKYIKKHVDNSNLSMNLLSNEFFISTSYLSRLFKTVTGESYGDLLSDFRLLKMMELLNSTDMRDCDIGRQIGICDAHYLSIWFRKMTGYSVTEYRRLSL